MTACSNPIEIEVKFHLPAADPIRKRLIDMGAAAGPRGFETNLRFESPDDSLRAKDQLLRLRQDDKCRLTFKQKPTCNDTEFKVYRELEVVVSDHDTMAAILESLGYRAVQCYEKWRQTYTLDDVEICIDEMPYGLFLEIEGTPEGIKSAAVHLGLPWDQRILINYLAIFERLRKLHDLPFSDLTFDNFLGYPVDITPHLPLFQISKAP